MDIKLIFDSLEGDYSYNPGCKQWIACRDGLHAFFCLDDNPQDITLRLSKSSSKNSYFVKRSGRDHIKVLLSDGSTVRINVYENLTNLLSKFKDGCYISVLA